MAKARGDLGPLERAVMEHVWNHGRAVTVREVFEALAGKRQLAYTTVMTIMERLWRKGLLSRRKVGRPYLYEAKRTRAEHTAAVVRHVLQGARDRQGVLLGFVRSVGDRDLAELGRAIREVERERRPRRDR